MRYFKKLDEPRTEPPPVSSILGEVEIWSLEFMLRLVYTIVGVILVLWSWGILVTQIHRFPAVNIFSTLIALFTLLLGIRCALSIFKGVSGKLAFVMLLWLGLQFYLLYVH